MKYTELAYIEPVEDYTDKDDCLCRVQIMSGKFRHEYIIMLIPTSIFRYYFWGVTAEVLTFDDKFKCIGVRDLCKEDMGKYGISVCHALTYNPYTTDLLASNGFVFNIKDSMFYRNYSNVCKRINQEICTAKNFAMVIYTLNGGLLSINFAKDLTPKDVYYKYALSVGFVPMDKTKLTTLVPKTKEEYNKKEKLNQEEIDKLIRDMQSR